MFVVFLVIIFSCLVSSDEKIAVLILARGGSKGIRLKNLQEVGGVSLLARAINTAKLAELLDVTVSTDHPLIALKSLESGATVFHRSRITATNWAPSIWGAAEFLAQRPEITVLILIQATSPFIRPDNIKLALKYIQAPDPCDCVFTVTKSYKLRWRKFGGSLLSINFDYRNRPRRQDWEGELIETGAFYVSRRNLIEKGYFQNKNCTVIQVSAAESLEVDSHYDLQVASALLSSNLV